MRNMEDVEVIADGSPLNEHLKLLGFLEMNGDPPQPVPQTICLDPKKAKGETIDCDVVEEVLILRAANLLFEDDLDHVDCIFANYELAKHESYKCMFKGKASVFVLILGWFVYVYIGGWAFLFVTAFFVFRTFRYFLHRRTRLKRLRLLMSVIQANFSLFVRVLKFVYENEQILRNRFGADSCHRAFNVLSKLKTDFIGMQQEINDVLAGATLTLLDRVPLCDYVENPNGYLCQNCDYYKAERLTQLHNIYMLLQSQFLTRLIFSLVPNLLAKPDDNYDAVTDVVDKVTFRLHDVNRLLNKKFKFVITNGLLVDDTKPSSKLPPRARRTALSADTLANNIHELSNSLQFSLIKSRELENGIHNGEPLKVEPDLDEIQKELTSCLVHIEDMLILNRKRNPVNENVEMVSEEDVAGETIRECDLGYPDENPDVGDDIFEGSTDSIQEDSQNSAYDYEEEVELLAKRQQAHVLLELKNRLKSQAEDWARREALVCKRKGLSPMEPPVERFKETNDGSDEESRGRRSKTKFQRSMKRPRYRQRNEDHHIESETYSSRKKYDSSRIHNNARDPPMFAQFIHQARNKMGTVSPEESYCGSGENSNTDD